MSMILGLSTLSDVSIDRVLANPALIWRVIAPDDPGAFAHALGKGDKQGFFARIFGKEETTPDASESGDLKFEEGEVKETDLDKAWHGIHFLLTGSNWEGDPPLNFLLAGGTEVGDVDVGYGPARVFHSAEVVEIRDALEQVKEAGLRARYRPEVMMEEDLYPMIWDHNPEEDDVLGYLMEYFRELKRFLNDATGKGLGLVVTMQ